MEVNINPFGAVTYAAGNNVNLRCAVTLLGVMIGTDVRVNITWTRSGIPFSGISCCVTVHEEMVSPTIYLLFCSLVPIPTLQVEIRPAAAVTYAGNNVNLRCTATLTGGVTETDVRVNITCTATSSVQGSEVAFTESFTWSYQMGNRVGATTGFTTVQMGIMNRDLSLARSTSELTMTETTAGMYTYRCQANLDLSADNIFGRNDYYPVTVTGELNPNLLYTFC